MGRSPGFTDQPGYTLGKFQDSKRSCLKGGLMALEEEHRLSVFWIPQACIQVHLQRCEHVHRQPNSSSIRHYPFPSSK